MTLHFTRVITPKQARARVTYAIWVGKLIRRPCEKCGDKKSFAHHDDYQKPLEVRGLCSSHHHEAHGKTAGGAKNKRKVPEGYNPPVVTLYRYQASVRPPYKSRRKLPEWFLNKLKLEEEAKKT